MVSIVLSISVQIVAVLLKKIITQTIAEAVLAILWGAKILILQLAIIVQNILARQAVALPKNPTERIIVLVILVQAVMTSGLMADSIV